VKKTNLFEPEAVINRGEGVVRALLEVLTDRKLKRLCTFEATFSREKQYKMPRKVALNRTIRGTPMTNRQMKYGIRKVPPPFTAHLYGNQQTFPRPTQ
jgi:hypothetical protein